ncbi:MAG: hypothetical protein GWO12_17085 [Gemmatimonadetes bacterium]|uniref:Uncharacterized protein n=1 Tax=Candidatus Kutchimonas denitrificans TaxID=3056748 RepID=A0AAE4ZAT7_9BACT|nr:hypothetical protein [Candidatus Kutchimonas denitrificans]
MRDELQQVEVDTIPEQLEDLGRETVYDVIDVLISEQTADHLRRALTKALPGWLRPFVGLALRAVFPDRANLVLKGLADRVFP